MAQPTEFRQIQLVGRKIRQLRKERQQTQTELAARLGIQQSDLSRMEKGEYRVSLDTLFKILAEFRIGVGEFFDEVARESVTPHDLRLLSEFHELDASSQTEVETFIHDHRLARRRPQRDLGQASSPGPASRGWNRTGTA